MLQDEYLAKALEGLHGARSELANGRYNNASNRAYFACFQAAIAAMLEAGLPVRERWGHDDVQATFAGDLVHRRKFYPSELRGVLNSLYGLRLSGDYQPRPVSRKEAEGSVKRAADFVGRIQERLGR